RRYQEGHRKVVFAGQWRVDKTRIDDGKTHILPLKIGLQRLCHDIESGLAGAIGYRAGQANKASDRSHDGNMTLPTANHGRHDGAQAIDRAHHIDVDGTGKSLAIKARGYNWLICSGG